MDIWGEKEWSWSRQFPATIFTFSGHHMVCTVLVSMLLQPEGIVFVVPWLLLYISVRERLLLDWIVYSFINWNVVTLTSELVEFSFLILYRFCKQKTDSIINVNCWSVFLFEKKLWIYILCVHYQLIIQWLSIFLLAGDLHWQM